jgi:hypothetical protein
MPESVSTIEQGSTNKNKRAVHTKHPSSTLPKSSIRKRATDRNNKIALLVAVATALGAIGSAGITGVLESKNIDKRLQNLGPIQMDGGGWEVGYEGRGWNLGTPKGGSGDPIEGIPQNSRIFTYHVKFNQKFSFPPHVVISVSTLDEWKNGGVKWIVEPSDVSNDGFDVTIYAYPESVIYTIGGNWLAFQR